jgi:hypothetical protein
MFKSLGMFGRETETGAVSSGFIETNHEVWAIERHNKRNRLSMSLRERIPFVSRIVCDTVDLDWAHNIGENGKAIDEITSHERPTEIEGKRLPDSRVPLSNRDSKLTNLTEREKSERT